ncbi:MAG: hypothetical protein A3J38_04365 [Gammaproteobacteria bacterium RIFCSPHIGHO2_12_FULL_45_9]|nr:MAG: hypothetical protein A3J38_04365 [Gammaproteobacteria bacterium RIFCSPHIGHO2_12_FULL_45_9]
MSKPVRSHDKKRWNGRLLIMICIPLLLIIIGIGIRIIQAHALKNETESLALLNVSAIRAEPGGAYEELVLPGNLQGWHEASLYSRTNGYVVEWAVDMGAHVKQGDLLAVITTPEVDASLKQTESDLLTAQANYQFAKTTFFRWDHLLKTESVSPQETDEKVRNAKAMASTMDSTRANRDRLQALVSFERIVAPFDGVISSRTTDIGKLIDAGSAGNMPLFHVVQSNKLRLYVRVPEYFASRLTPNLHATLHFTEHPGKVYDGVLLNMADAIDPRSRTFLVQFAVENPDNALLAGSYTDVHFKLPISSTLVQLPVNTLIFRSEGLQVATITSQGKITLRPISVERNLGNTVEVVSGVKRGELVVLNPPDILTTGQQVRLVGAKTA